MDCIECHEPLPMPTPDPYRCSACRAGVHRVTDFRVDRVEIRDRDWWRLPPQTRRLFEVYARELPCVAPGVWAFELAINRWSEIEASMRRLEAGTRTGESITSATINRR